MIFYIAVLITLFFVFIYAFCVRRRQPILYVGMEANDMIEEVLWLQLSPKRFHILPPDWGVLRRSRCVHILL